MQFQDASQNTTTDREKRRAKRAYNAVVKAFLACDSEAFIKAYRRAAKQGLSFDHDSAIEVCYRGLQD